MIPAVVPDDDEVTAGSVGRIVCDVVGMEGGDGVDGKGRSDIGFNDGTGGVDETPLPMDLFLQKAHLAPEPSGPGHWGRPIRHVMTEVLPDDEGCNSRSMPAETPEWDGWLTETGR